MFNYPPLTNENIAKNLGLLPKGIYKFRCIGSDYKTSKSDGITIIVKLDLKVFNNPPLDNVTISCWLSQKMLLRIRHFWESVKCPQYLLRPPMGSQDWVHQDTSPREGYVSVDVKNDPGFGPKNIVVDFVSEEAVHTLNSKTVSVTSHTAELNLAGTITPGEIPF